MRSMKTIIIFRVFKQIPKAALFYNLTKEKKTQTRNTLFSQNTFKFSPIDFVRFNFHDISFFSLESYVRQNLV